MRENSGEGIHEGGNRREDTGGRVQEAGYMREVT
jgi:hypothetical protein